MKLPKELEAIRGKRIWVNYPMIWDETGHDGQGAYRKPPINPNTLRNAIPTNPSTWADFDTANANIGKTASFTDKDGNIKECTIHGVGICLYNSGVFGLDLDSVVRIDAATGQRFMTYEAKQIIEELHTYVEVSPSGTGLHVLCLGRLDIPNIRYSASGKRSICDPDHKQSGKFEIYQSGKYLTITGDSVGSYALRDCTEDFKETYRRHFLTAAGGSSPVVSSSGPTVSASFVGAGSSGVKREQWLSYIRRSTDDEILEGIFKSGKLGRRVAALYDGDMSAYNNGHSEADCALITYLYCFTDDEDLTDRLFRRSALCRDKWLDRPDYRARTIKRARSSYYPLIGHIEFTAEDRKAYAQARQAEEEAAEAKRLGYSSVSEYRNRYGAALIQRARESRRENRNKRPPF